MQTKQTNVLKLNKQTSFRYPLAKMLGFAIPLLVFCAIEGALGLSLLLPLPFTRPTIAICKLTNTQAGRSVLVTISVILACLLLAPLYDLTRFHDRPEDTAGANAQRR